MGVKFKDLLQPEEISWDELRDKKIAVDASLMIYQFLSSIMQKDGTPLTDSNGNVTSHLVGIFSRVTNLMDKGLKLCFVFDGKAPELKNKERERRRERKNIASEKYEEAREKEDEEMMHRYSRQLSFLTHEMVEEAKELIKALGLPVIQAPSEAEAQAAYMCRKKDVWAVATQDADVLIHGAPKVLRNLTLSQKKLSGSTYTRVHPEILELNKVLDNLGIDLDQLIVIAILIGTDFNVGGVKGLGPKKALKLVQDGKSFDVIFKISITKYSDLG